MVDFDTVTTSLWFLYQDPNQSGVDTKTERLSRDFSRELKICRPCLIEYGPLLRPLAWNHAIYSLVRELYIVLYCKPVLLKRQLTSQLFDPLFDPIRFLTHLAPPLSPVPTYVKV
jgi:hypothetical protein